MQHPEPVREALKVADFHTPLTHRDTPGSSYRQMEDALFVLARALRSALAEKAASPEKAYREIIDMLLMRMNPVTAAYRHGNPLSSARLSVLSNYQIDVEEQLRLIDGSLKAKEQGL